MDAEESVVDAEDSVVDVFRFGFRLVVRGLAPGVSSAPEVDVDGVSLPDLVASGEVVVPVEVVGWFAPPSGAVADD